MKIFTPAQKDANSFFDEITFHSKNEFVYGNLGDDTSRFQTILIQWPEQIFNWKEPTDSQLAYLTQEIQKWKQQSNIIYIVHNEKPHLGMTKSFQRLYDLIESSSDIMLHFGNYSKGKFEKKYLGAKHLILQHPLYTRSFPYYTKEEARLKLGIDQNREVVIAPGKIRTLKERNLVLNSFKKIKNANRTLIVPNMFWKTLPIEFVGRHKLKSIFDVNKWIEKLINGSYKLPSYLIHYRYLKAKQLALYIAASDVIFIPRIQILNSGNFYLGLTFKKIIVGPEVGNLTEMLKEFDFPIFQSNKSSSVINALENAFELSANVEEIYKNNNTEAYQPQNIASNLDLIIENG